MGAHFSLYYKRCKQLFKHSITAWTGVGSYIPPKKVGDYRFTRTGERPPKIELARDKQYYKEERSGGKGNLTLHLENRQQRLRWGYSDTERKWRIQYFLDRYLHPDEPIRVQAIYRQLNPARRLYRLPWDFAYTKMQPVFGTYISQHIRAFVPKIVMTVLAMDAVYYHCKYEYRQWTRPGGAQAYLLPYMHPRWEEIEEQYPGIHEKAFPSKGFDDWYDRGFNRYLNEVLKGDPGVTSRPW